MGNRTVPALRRVTICPGGRWSRGPVETVDICLLSRRSCVRIAPGVPKLGHVCGRLITKARQGSLNGIHLEGTTWRAFPFPSNFVATGSRKLSPDAAAGCRVKGSFNVPPRPRFSSEPRLTSPLMPLARVARELTLDDDDGGHHSSSSSGVGLENENAWLITYLTRTWEYRGAEFAVAHYGPELIVAVASLLDEMIRLGDMSRPRNPGAYLRRCLDWAHATREHPDATPVPVAASPASEIPSHLRVLRGGKEAAS